VWTLAGARRARMRKKGAHKCAAAFLAALLGLQPVLATPPSNEVATGRFTLVLDPDSADRLQLGLEDVPVEDALMSHLTRSPSVLRFNIVGYPPKGQSGWHYHPGLSLVTVLDGVIDWYDASCVRRAYKSGEFFIEGNRQIHLAGNSGSIPARMVVTHIIAKGLPPRVSVAAPPCAAALGLH
jgi:quercetin dioxygenase-like cupin family protein